MTLFAGHYGSGKTNLAVNYALYLRGEGREVMVADLDIVNPYFRTKDSEQALNRAGIRLISSKYANSNVDVPSLPGEAYAIIDRKDMYAVADVGGDDRGALALGRYSPAIIEEGDYEFIFVINRFRPRTRTAEDTLEVMREVERAASMKFTAIANNSNLGAETTPEDVLSSVGYAEEVSGRSGLPVKLTSVREELAGELEGRISGLYPIKLYLKSEWVL